MRYPTKVFLIGLACLAAFLGGSSVGHATLPIDDGLLAPNPPEVTAEAWILYDDTFGKVLAEVEPDQRRAVASTTKIMTALVVLELAEMDELATISTNATLAGGSEVGLVADEPPWSVEDLLSGLMLRSANDAAVALAEHVGGSVAGFADLMNIRASELGMLDSRFVNPHGLDHPDHYSSARDLLALARAAMDNPKFARLVLIRSANLPPTPEGEPRVELNRNQLLTSYPGSIGIKTGFTSQAQQTLVAAAELDGRRLYAVVLGCTDHYGDAATLLDYGFEEFSAATLVPVTSETRRPLAGGRQPAVEEDFELLISQEAGQELQAADPTAPVDPEPPPPDDQASETEAPPVVSEVARAPELPGLRDALTWFARYWNWVLARDG